MGIVDEGPSKRLKTEATILASPDEEKDYPLKAPIVEDEEVIPATKCELTLVPSKIETWWTHSRWNYPVDDGLLAKRMMILKNKGLHLQFSVPKTLQKEEAGELLEKFICAARTIHLDWVELYFAEEDDDWGPFSLRNELEALNSILSSMNSISASEYAIKEALDVLRETIVSKIVSLGDFQLENMNLVPDNDKYVIDAKKLLDWGKTCGMVTKLDVAGFQEAGIGLVASEDIKISDVALEVPMKLVISDVFIESDLPGSLNKGNLSPGDKRLLWIMRERNCPRQELMEFFELLPKGHKSGVWFGDDVVQMLGLTPLEDSLGSEISCLDRQFHSVIKPILEENRAMFRSCSFEEFMLAWEIWNSHSVSILFPDDEIRPCLVPVAGFFNHSQCPNVLYGKYVGGTIQFIASRPCKKGEQCYLSYGNLSGAEFITFYGFLPKDVNYHDVVTFGYGGYSGEKTFWPPENKSHWTLQMAKGKWPYSEKSGLTNGLVEHVKAVMKAQSGDDSIPSGEEVYDRLADLFAAHKMGLRMVAQCNITSRPDVKLACDYRELFTDVLIDVIGECYKKLHPEEFVD